MPFVFVVLVVRQYRVEPIVESSLYLAETAMEQEGSFLEDRVVPDVIIL